ncbi:hypothetical protein MJO28_009737 [Puccinia striiformis f. sp. tritici]|uniref:Uncharacterized protein n=3 Tax=Puccinia striiformis TaxID=27350 RepID=A0A0L0V850_9BASI|nr:hypothetical protein Pst134EA_017405 [Puccinia striiformis f. sp. tritici]KAI9607398.1 hypothetical protein H4Q26_005918 [Puccinia striiformis f. sp. tritici PST-130]KNE95381.1 hypothetical protein PSTG_11234 [Puccinia striiformis f. sp. tritici PST-78]POW10573.1 hypothetical protein PSTT_05933 [Puccinia striiformis]KAH9450809.1 hypothetical protein Pst134EB_018320 [Puccinia striiformis f. sp. tritici]KAH9461096.1 hypothetical protein Pst134EA_017405 [Puccinia striiformis f. sp. tritici]
MITALILNFLCFQIFTVAAGVNTLNDFHLNLPRGTPLLPPTGMTLKFLALGNGTQHYKCMKDSTAGNKLTWALHGADAQLYDVSKDSSIAAELPNALMKGSKSHIKKPDLKNYPIIGRHFFYPKEAGGLLMPSFEIGRQKIMLTKAHFTPSPLSADRNVDWLQLDTIRGDFANRVYRTNTRGGKVHAPECKSTELYSYKSEAYAAIYSFYASAKKPHA